MSFYIVPFFISLILCFYSVGANKFLRNNNIVEVKEDHQGKIISAGDVPKLLLVTSCNIYVNMQECLELTSPAKVFDYPCRPYNKRIKCFPGPMFRIITGASG